jgi:hypothetical protein
LASGHFANLRGRLVRGGQTASNDIDGYFECELPRLASGELERELNLLDPHKVWTWDPASRRPSPGHAKRQLPMWHVDRVELYPHYGQLNPHDGQLSGIRDSYGHEPEFSIRVPPLATQRQATWDHQDCE